MVWRSKLFAVGVVAIGLTVPALAFQVRPNPTLTPGSLRPDGNEASIVCGYMKPRTSLPHGLRDKILRSYNLPPGTHPDYEIDHLIPRCLGGSDDDPANLWPQPRRGIESTWNAEAKDRLEHLICEMVRNQQLDLATMQKAIAEDWVAVYHKYYEPH